MNRKNRISIYKSIFLFLFAFILISCKDDPVEIQGLDGMNFTFQIMERHTDDQHAIGAKMLSFQTEKEYPSCNYKILHSIEPHGTTIDIKITGIQLEGSISLNYPAPASFCDTLYIGEMDYQINFINGGLRDVYQVNVGKDSIMVIPNGDPKFTKSKSELYWRYPFNSFVYLCGTDKDNQWIANHFIDTLISTLGFKEYKFPGYGEIPYSLSTGGYYYNMPSRFFKYNKDVDFENAAKFLFAYCDKYIRNNKKIEISLENWINYKYNSLYPSFN